MAKLNNNDPHAAREGEKYENPIPSREYILQYLQECGRFVRREELVEILELEMPEQQEALRRRLRAMERDGQLVFNRRGGYGLPDDSDLIKGRVIGHKDGFGFVVPDEGGDDLFLTASQMRSVFGGDKVLVRVSGQDRRGRREAAIVEVLERNTQSVVGRFFQEDDIAYVTPNNKRISQDVLIPPGQQGDARNGQIVVAAITIQPTTHFQPVGRIIEILGEHLAPGMEVDVAVRSHSIPYIWPDAVLDEVGKITPQVSEPEKTSRVDLRDLPLVTIDGEDAKDFDDAVYCEKRNGGGWTLYVAIADVSHYVRPNTALDQEAERRGNSVYFPGHVVPMLPEILSNELCSLKPQVDRLCMVCEMVISAAGALSRYRFYEAVMHSHARLTYNEVANMLEGSTTRSAQHKALLPHLKELLKLYKVLHAARQKRGAIDFETVETKVVFGPHRKIQQIVPVQRTVAHKLIEECMLMANVAAARFVSKYKLPNLFRIHQGPSVEKLQDLRTFLQGLGLQLPNGGKEPKPKDYAELLLKIVKRPDARLIQTVLLRSLSQAVYSPENIGHFGLAFTAYAHFTSPIRRYPDLLLHRAIRHILANGTPETFMYGHEAMINMGGHCSVTERRADEATRDALDTLKCEYIKAHLGEEFAGVITSVTGFGLFVELKDIYVEGLVHVTALKNDYYKFDATNRRMCGERTGVVFHLGDQIKVRVARVDIDNREIDFDLAGNVSAPSKQKKSAKKPAAKKKPVKKVMGKKSKRR